MLLQCQQPSQINSKVHPLIDNELLEIFLTIRSPPFLFLCGGHIQTITQTFCHTISLMIQQIS